MKPHSASCWTWGPVEDPWYVLYREGRDVGDLALSPSWRTFMPKERAACEPLRWAAVRGRGYRPGLVLVATSNGLVAWLGPDRSAWGALAGVKLPPLVDGTVRLDFPRLPVVVARERRAA
jgi:hypothetical protein